MNEAEYLQPRPQGVSLKKPIFRGKSPGDEVGVSYEELWRSRRVLSVEAVGRGG